MDLNRCRVEPRPPEAIHPLKVVSGKELSTAQSQSPGNVPSVIYEPLWEWTLLQLGLPMSINQFVLSWTRRRLDIIKESICIRRSQFSEPKHDKTMQSYAIQSDIQKVSFKQPRAQHRPSNLTTKSFKWILSAHSQICKFLAKEIKREKPSDHGVWLEFRHSLPKQQPCPPQVWPPTLLDVARLWQPTGR